MVSCLYFQFAEDLVWVLNKQNFRVWANDFDLDAQTVYEKNLGKMGAI
ncbi:MAG: hypothetical protein LBE76_09180 [Nitrososphaerota archaeon]|jgi:hypothetical protein|nr:hypothetical protein [Nitrososphaerota archaeon]